MLGGGPPLKNLEVTQSGNPVATKSRNVKRPLVMKCGPNFYGTCAYIDDNPRRCRVGLS